MDLFRYFRRSPVTKPTHDATASIELPELEIQRDNEVNHTMHSSSSRNFSSISVAPTNRIFVSSMVQKEENDQTTNNLTNNPSYLAKHFCIMKTIRICPQQFLEPSSSYNMSNWNVNVIFWLLNITSIVHVIDKIKYTVFQTDEKSVFERHVMLIFFTNQLVFQLWYTRIVLADSAKVTRLLSTIAELNKLPASGIKKNIVAGIGIATVVTVIAYRVQGYMLLRSWSTWGVFEEKSFDCLAFFLFWDKGNSTSCYIAQVQSFNESLGISTMVALGAIQLVIQVIGTMQLIFLRNIFLFIALEFYELSMSFADNFENEADSDIRGIWRRYYSLRKLTKLSDDSFGVLIKLLHLDSILVIMYIMLEWFIRVDYDFWFIFNFLYLTTMLSYYFSIRGSILMSTFRVWIHKYSNKCDKSVPECQHWKLAIILDDYSHNPVGVGIRSFYVDETFVWKMLGAIASSFLFFAGPLTAST